MSGGSLDGFWRVSPLWRVSVGFQGGIYWIVQMACEVSRCIGLVKSRTGQVSTGHVRPGYVRPVFKTMSPRRPRSSLGDQSPCPESE